MARKSPSSSIAGRVSGAGSFVFICQLDRAHWSWAGSHIFLAGAAICVAHRMASARRDAEFPAINWLDNRIVWVPPNSEGRLDSPKGPVIGSIHFDNFSNAR